MLTPTHVLLATGLFGSKKPSNNLPFLAVGGLFPDLAMYFLVVFLFFSSGDVNAFERIYNSSPFQEIDGLFHSLWLYPAIMIFNHFFGKQIQLFFFCLSAWFHVIVDFLVHAEDAHLSLWPISNWVFNSPVSYWDPNYYGNIFRFVDFGLLLLSGILTYRKLEKKKWKRTLLAFLILWGIAFSILTVLRLTETAVVSDQF